MLMGVGRLSPFIGGELARAPFNSIKCYVCACGGRHRRSSRRGCTSMYVCVSVRDESAKAKVMRAMVDGFSSGHANYIPRRSPRTGSAAVRGRSCS